MSEQRHYDLDQNLELVVAKMFEVPAKLKAKADPLLAACSLREALEGA
jgi:hypothetical protein